MHATQGILHDCRCNEQFMINEHCAPQERGFSAHEAYGLSKLAMMIMTKEMAERIPAPPTVNCLDPGTVNTKMLIAGVALKLIYVRLRPLHSQCH